MIPVRVSNDAVGTDELVDQLGVPAVPKLVEDTIGHSPGLGHLEPPFKRVGDSCGAMNLAMRSEERESLRLHRRKSHEEIGDVAAVGHDVSVRHSSGDVQNVTGRDGMTTPPVDLGAGLIGLSNHLSTDEDLPLSALYEDHVDDVFV